MAGDRANWPDEQRAGEICVKRLLSGERGHYGPMEHAQIVLNVGWFPHSVMQQARTHRVGVSFDVQSMRYTGERICRAADGALDLEDVFYLRPVGEYSDRQGRGQPDKHCASFVCRWRTIIKDSDLVIVNDRVKPMCNREDSAFFEGNSDHLLDLGVCLYIDRRSALVHDQ